MIWDRCTAGRQAGKLARMASWKTYFMRDLPAKLSACTRVNSRAEVVDANCEIDLVVFSLSLCIAYFLSALSRRYLELNLPAASFTVRDQLILLVFKLCLGPNIKQPGRQAPLHVSFLFDSIASVIPYRRSGGGRRIRSPLAPYLLQGKTFETLLFFLPL